MILIGPLSGIRESVAWMGDADSDYESELKGEECMSQQRFEKEVKGETW